MRGGRKTVWEGQPFAARPFYAAVSFLRIYKVRGTIAGEIKDK